MSWLLLALGILLPACGRAKEPRAAAGRAASDAPSNAPANDVTPASSDSAGRPRPPFPATQVPALRAQVGKEAAVRGRIKSTNTSGGGNQFLNFYSSELTLICFPEDVPRFRPMAWKSLIDQDVVVTGTLTEYKGKLQIKLREPQQIAVEKANGASTGSSTGAMAEQGTPARPITPSAPVAAALREIEPHHWQSAAGLHYRGRDPDGLTRKQHILRHAADDPDRSGPHGVFDAQGDAVFQLIDEAWQRVQKQKLRPVQEGDRVAYTVKMGRRIGYLGGSKGRSSNHPPLDRLFIVMEEGSTNVITAFPK